MSIKKNYKSAVGLQYDGKQSLAPQISLQADALDADEVVKIAKRFGIAVIEKPALADTLGKLELDQEIPESLYESVALVLNEIENRTKKS